MDSNVVLIIGLAVLLVVVIIFIVVNESKKRAAEESTTLSAEQFIREQNAKGKTDADLLGIDPEELRRVINEAYDAECMLPPPCPPDTVVGEDGCCELTAEQISKFQKGMMITEGIVREIMISFIFSKTVSTLYKAAKASGRLVSGAAKANLSSAAVAKAARTVTKGAARAATKSSIMTALKMGGRRMLSKAVTLVGGPLGVAILLAELVSLALDLIDPFGYDKYQPNTISRNIRNSMDVETQKGLMQGAPDLRTDYPLTFPLLLAFPDLEEDFTKEFMIKFLPTALSLFKGDDLVDIFKFMLNGTLPDDGSKTADDITKMMEDNFNLVTSVKRVERDNFIYNYYKGKGHEADIEKVPFLSTYRRYGVTLSEAGAKKYNDKHRDDHLKYGYLGRGGDCAKNLETKDACDADNACAWDTNAETCVGKDDGMTPEDYTPFVAMFTDTYRVLDTSNPGRVGEPNVIERRLPQKCVLAMPYAAVLAHCERGTGEHDPYTYGVRFNTSTGVCDYTDAYCDRYGLKWKPEQNNCDFYSEGQKYSEIIFGKTVTRGAIEFGNRVGNFFSKF